MREGRGLIASNARSGPIPLPPGVSGWVGRSGGFLGEPGVGFWGFGGTDSGVCRGCRGSAGSGLRSQAGEAFGVPQRGTACVNMILKRLTGERPSTVLAWHRVAEGNCVAERRGGEQPKANLSSQSSQTRQLNPIRPFGMASLRVKGEALALSLPEAITKHDHTIAKDSDGVWDEKAGKAEQLSVEILLGATESGEEVRALIVALKRVTTVEPRGVGR